MTRRRFRNGLLAALAAALLVLGLYRASQHVPQFYQDALQKRAADQQAQGDQLEEQVLQLHNSARREGRWRVVFTAAQINGWLAADLPEKFPRLLPETVSDPRVAIEPPRIRLACRFQSPKLSAVISLDVEPRLTDDPNVVAICLRNARIGALPLPQKKLLDAVRTAAQDAQLELHWAQSGGDPVALIALPPAGEERPEPGGRDVRLEAIQLNQGQLVLSGRTETRSAPRPPSPGQSDSNRTRQR